MFCRASKAVQWVVHCKPRSVEYMGVDHRGCDIGMVEQLLHGPDVGPACQ